MSKAGIIVTSGSATLSIADERSDGLPPDVGGVVTLGTFDAVGPAPNSACVSGSLAMPRLDAEATLAGWLAGDEMIGPVSSDGEGDRAGASPLLVERRDDGEVKATAEIEAAVATEIRRILTLRRARSAIFGETLFADPAWDIMLDLMEARLRRVRVSTTSLCIAAGVPATTAIRWIKILARKGLLIRRADADDGRRIYVELSDMAAEAMMRWGMQARS